MKLVLLVLSGLAFGELDHSLRDDMPAVTQEMVDYINSQGQWEASLDWVGSKTVGEVKRLVGAQPSKIYYPEAKQGALGQYTYIPTSFDSRTQWPGCIGAIRDQGQCGSSTAFASTEVVADRYCIENGVKVVLSPQYLVDCKTGGKGCNGDTSYNTWIFLEKYGVPPDYCHPYTSGSGVVSTCHTNCEEFYYAYNVYQYSGISNIQSVILTGGPVQAMMSVYQDFYAYKSGVYTHLTGSFEGYLGVKIIGWGVRSNTNYWIVANQWGTTSWGMNGFFYIAFGSCGIDSWVIAGSVFYYSTSQWLQVLGFAYLLLVS